MDNETHDKVLLVEGKTDVFAIAELMEANGVVWGDPPPVNIKALGSYTEIVRPRSIRSELRASYLTALGVVIDADSDPQARWQSLRNAYLPSIPNLPQTLPQTGLICEVPNLDVQFGVWMMPNNAMRGMLETFLAELVPDADNDLWQYASEAVQTARDSKGSKVKDVHLDKANVHTWLAWQEEPGLQLHQAIAHKFLNPQHPNAQRFVIWFKQLFQFASGLGMR